VRRRARNAARLLLLLLLLLLMLLLLLPGALACFGDGVVELERGLGRTCGRALGYEQPVERK